MNAWKDAFISFISYFCVYTWNKFNYRNSKVFIFNGTLFFGYAGNITRRCVSGVKMEMKMNKRLTVTLELTKYAEQTALES